MWDFSKKCYIVSGAAGVKNLIPLLNFLVLVQRSIRPNIQRYVGLDCFAI